MSPKRVTKPLDIYVRVSDVRGRSGESFISPQEQEDRCRAALTSRGLQAGEVFTDLDVSGGKMERPEFIKARARIEDGISGGIVVARLDRFGRTLVHSLLAMEEIERAGGVVITSEGDFDTSTATGELVLNMMLTLAQFELRRIRERWGEAQRRAVERGIHISSRTPPGYVRGADRRLNPHPKHADAIREAFAMAANGEPYARIAAYLTKQKLPVGGQAGVWESNRIRRLLANRVYLGEARYGEITNPNAHDPIVDEVTWNLAQRKPVGPPLTESAGAMLAGICRCASCSKAMRSQPARRGTVAAYRCATNSVSGRCPGPSTISLARLEEYVLDQFVQRAEMTLSPIEDDGSAKAAAAVEAERSYRAVLMDTDLRRQIGDKDHSQLVAKLHEEWQEALADVPTPSRGPKVGSVNLSELVAELRADWDAASLRELLASAIQAVFVRPAASRARNLPIEDRVRIVWQDQERLELPSRGHRFEPRAYSW